MKISPTSTDQTLSNWRRALFMRTLAGWCTMC